MSSIAADISLCSSRGGLRPTRWGSGGGYHLEDAPILVALRRDLEGGSISATASERRATSLVSRLHQEPRQGTSLVEELVMAWREHLNEATGGQLDIFYSGSETPTVWM